MEWVVRSGPVGTSFNILPNLHTVERTERNIPSQKTDDGCRKKKKKVNEMPAAAAHPHGAVKRVRNLYYQRINLLVKRRGMTWNIINR